MNNQNALLELNGCATELTHVKTLIDGLGITSSIVPYLTKYSVVRACGSIEQSFKTVIADYVSNRGKQQIKRFIKLKVREGSANPSYNNMCKFLGDFDDTWKSSFKTTIDAEANKAILMTSLQSLVDARNTFAHGGSPSASIDDVIRYFNDAKRFIEIMDSIVV